MPIENHLGIQGSNQLCRSSLLGSLGADQTRSNRPGFTL